MERCSSTRGRSTAAGNRIQRPSHAPSTTPSHALHTYHRSASVLHSTRVWCAVALEASTSDMRSGPWRAWQGSRLPPSYDKGGWDDVRHPNRGHPRSAHSLALGSRQPVTGNALIMHRPRSGCVRGPARSSSPLECRLHDRGLAGGSRRRPELESRSLAFQFRAGTHQHLDLTCTWDEEEQIFDHL